MKILLVAEAPRSLGEFRRRWVRALHRRYLARYRHTLSATVARLADTHELTVLAGREVLDSARLPAAVAARLYDEELFRNDSAALAQRTRDLMRVWWPERHEAPLTFDGVWLPDLMPVTKGILLRLDVVEYVGIVERALDELKPDEIFLMTGASTVERIAQALAFERAVPVRVAGRSVASTLLAISGRALRLREERRALAAHLHHRRQPVTPTAGAPVLFSVSHARHFMVVDPLVAALRGRGRACVVLAATSENRALRPPLRRLAATGAVGGHVMDHLPAPEARRLVRELRPIQRQLLARLDGRPRDPLAAVVVPYARDAITHTLATARLYLAAAGRALDASRPAAVVITSDRRMSERAFALAARQRDIPSLLFYGGALLGRDQTNLFDVGDRILVLGEHVRSGLIRQGIDAARVAAVGDPRSDEARRVPQAQLRRDVCEDFGFDPARPLLIMVSKYVSLLFSATEKAAFYRTVIDATRGLGDVSVLVKVHPNENIATLRDDVVRWGWPDARLTKDYDIHRLFGAADAAVMVTSMAGIEAMAMGCPVVAVQTQGKDFEGGGMPPYVTDGAVARVDMGDAVALAAALRTLIGDAAARAALVERGRRFAARYLHPVDGALAERLLAVVDAIRAARDTGAHA